MRFSDRSVIVTGAASGFGLATARAFGAEGARVVCADIDPRGAARAADEIGAAGGAAVSIAADVADSDGFRGIVAAATEAFGGLDIIVNNAGIAHPGMAIYKLPEEDYDRVFAVNVKSVYLSCVHGVPALRARGGGVIVNVASIGAKRPRPGMTPYNATKGAVMTMTRGLAGELARFKIRVNAVNPLASDTGFMKVAMGVEDGLSDDQRAKLAADVPLGRLTEPKDVASAILYLSSDDAEFLTGVCLDVDGGKGI